MGGGFGTAGNTQVLLDGVAIPAANIVSVSGTQVVYTAPAHSAGVVLVTVKVNGAALAGSVAYQYGTVSTLPGIKSSGGSLGNPSAQPVNRPTGPMQPGSPQPVPGSRPENVLAVIRSQKNIGGDGL
jgi:hypothetical protein